MLVVNTETVPGYQVTEVKGLVQGNTVRAKHAGRDIAAGFKNLVGGELKGYTELLTESRREAVERMLAQAQQLGANAILNVRFSTSAVTGGAAELYAYGTAAVIVPIAQAGAHAGPGAHAGTAPAGTTGQPGGYGASPVGQPPAAGGYSGHAGPAPQDSSGGRTLGGVGHGQGGHGGEGHGGR